MRPHGSTSITTVEQTMVFTTRMRTGRKVNTLSLIATVVYHLAECIW